MRVAEGATTSQLLGGLQRELVFVLDVDDTLRAHNFDKALRQSAGTSHRSSLPC